MTTAAILATLAVFAKPMGAARAVVSPAAMSWRSSRASTFRLVRRLVRLDAGRGLFSRERWAALADLKLGLVGAHAPGHDAAFELRAFVGGERGYEDPVTGSLNASVAQWQMRTGLAAPKYVAAQGHVLHRAGRVHLEREGEVIWVGGDVVCCVQGEVSL